MPCLRRMLKMPFRDFLENAHHVGINHNIAESPTYFYSADGMRRLKKTGLKPIDKARRRVLTSTNAEERVFWMQVWGLD